MCECANVCVVRVEAKAMEKMRAGPCAATGLDGVTAWGSFIGSRSKFDHTAILRLRGVGHQLVVMFIIVKDECNSIHHVNERAFPAGTISLEGGRTA